MAGAATARNGSPAEEPGRCRVGRGQTSRRRPGEARRRALLTLVTAVATSAASGGATPGELRQRWEGAWVVIKGAVGSTCDGAYTNNRIEGGGAKVGAGWEGRMRRLSGFVGKRMSQNDPQARSALEEAARQQLFEPGELGSVRRVKAGNGRIELRVDLGARVLLPSRHGPFSLLREADCGVELRIDVPKKAIKEGSVEKLETALAEAVERHSSETAARSSEIWNGREDEPFPADYESRLRDYVIWRNAEIERGLAAATGSLRALAVSLPPSEAYLASFARGARRAAEVLDHQSCETLVGSDFEDFRQKLGWGEVGTGADAFLQVAVENPGDEGSEEYAVLNREAYGEGQRAAYALEMTERLSGCRLDSPEEAGR